MRYRIANDIIIKSENAAKPVAQISKKTERFIESMTPVETSLDFGCGKLRYLNTILKTTNNLDVTDSDIQLYRTQMLLGNKTSIYELSNNTNRWNMVRINEFYSADYLYNRIFCLNVLQIIPIVDLRKNILLRLAAKLNRDGEIIIIVQFRNSEFKKMYSKPNAIKYGDGMIIKNKRGSSFYGFIVPSSLHNLVNECGLVVIESRIVDGSCFVIAKQNPATL